MPVENIVVRQERTKNRRLIQFGRRHLLNVMSLPYVIDDVTVLSLSIYFKLLFNCKYFSY